MAAFPTTHWTVLLSAREDAPSRQRALEHLFAAYGRPIYFFFRRKGLDVPSAEDALQDFFVQLMERDPFARLDPARGRFRSYLRTALDHYLVSRHERQHALKRGGGVTILSLDLEAAERDLTHAPAVAELAYDREWALSVMQRALERLRVEYEDGRRRGRADTVLRFFSLDEAPSYAEAAGECGMTVPQFKAALHRARARFRALLREEVRTTVGDEREGEGELAELVRALSP